MVNNFFSRKFGKLSNKRIDQSTRSFYDAPRWWRPLQLRPKQNRSYSSKSNENAIEFFLLAIQCYKNYNVNKHFAFEMDSKCESIKNLMLARILPPSTEARKGTRCVSFVVGKKIILNAHNIFFSSFVSSTRQLKKLFQSRTHTQHSLQNRIKKLPQNDLL